MVKRWKIFLVLITLLSILLTGCGSGFITSSDKNRGDMLSENQVLRMSQLSEIPSLDNIKVSEFSAMNLLVNVQEGLYRNGKFKIEEGIAKSVSISPDKKTFIFTLREDALWSDGKPVTAHDFEYGWKRLLDPANRSEFAFVMYPILNAQEYNLGIDGTGKPVKVTSDQVGVFAEDDYTLVVKLKHPTINFLKMTTLPIFYPQRKDIVEKYKEDYGKQPDKIVFNGPFVVKKLSHNLVELEKNEQYWDKNNVKLQRVELHTIKDITTGVQLYNAGRLDTTQLNEELVDAYKDTPEFLTVEQARTTLLLLNQRQAFFRNAKIRKAISLVIDRETLAYSVLKDGSKPAGSLVPPTLHGVNNQSFRNGEIVESDILQAKKLFAEGLKELNVNKPPDSIELSSYDSSLSKSTILAIKESLKTNFNWDVKLDPHPKKIHLANLAQGKFDMALIGYSANFNDPLFYFEIFQSPNPINFSKFKNSKYDQLVYLAKQEADPKKQYQLLLEAEKILVDTEGEGEAAIAPLYYEAKAYLQKTYVKDLIRHPYSTEYTLKWAYIEKH